jgi:taurine dioxygenase
MAQAQIKAQVGAQVEAGIKVQHAARDWPFQIRPLHPVLGCEITGITLQEAVSPALFAKVYEAFLDYELILFNDVDLPPATQVAFARNFGEVQVHVLSQYHGYKEHPEIYMLSNLDKNGNASGRHPDRGTLYWHTDGSWRERTGQATMMYSEIVPDAGGETQFADMYSAYDLLPAAIKARIDGRCAIHNFDFSRTRRHGEDPLTAEQKAKVPPIAHPIVRTHPNTGRKAVFLGDHAESIEGMDYDQGRALIEEINMMITPHARVYSHKWTPRQCMVWDNRCTLHRATGFDEARLKRVMRRCTIVGDKPF